MCSGVESDRVFELSRCIFDKRCNVSFCQGIKSLVHCLATKEYLTVSLKGFYKIIEKTFTNGFVGTHQPSAFRGVGQIT